MIYCGQELGEHGMDTECFSGRDGRTTIFDDWSVDSIRRWRNVGKFDNKFLNEDEKQYKEVISGYREWSELSHAEDWLCLLYTSRCV